MNKQYNNFITNANNIHNYKYDYSLVKYKNAITPIIIICPEHGNFLQLPRTHINNKSGCKKCADIIRGYNKSNKTKQNMFKTLNKIHNNYYDYSKFFYINNYDKSIIICPKHGEFLQSYNNHHSGKGCDKCANITRKNKTTKSINVFIKEASLLHNNKYSYNNFIYNNNNTKSYITCSEHGDFLQTPSSHLSGSGCKMCNNTSKGEKLILNLLIKYDITYIKEYSIKDCVSTKNKPLRFDFYIPELNLCIEYDGIQHFKVCKFYNHITDFNLIKKYDNIKNTYCVENNIKLLRISYKQFKLIPKIIKDLFNIND